MTTATTADNIFQQQVNGGGGVESESQTAATAEALGIAAAACVTVKRTSSSRRTFHFTPPSSYRLMALMRKNLIQTFRNIGYTKKKKNDSRARFLSFFNNFPFFFPQLLVCSSSSFSCRSFRPFCFVWPSGTTLPLSNWPSSMKNWMRAKAASTAITQPPALTRCTVAVIYVSLTMKQSSR